MKQNSDVHHLGNVEEVVVVDELGERGRRHEVGRRLLLRRKSQKDEESFPMNVVQGAANVDV